MTEKEKTVNLYINGILSPKDEIKWDVMSVILTDHFGGDSHHIHNPFLAISEPHKLIMKSVKENPGTSAMVGLGLLGLGAFSAYSGQDTNMLMLKALFVALETVLKEEANKVYPKIFEQIHEILLENIEEEEDLVINLFGHSHGGMVIDRFLVSEEFKILVDEFHFKLNIFIAGCPIIVRQPKQKNCKLRQLNNTKDPISLVFTSRKKYPKYVISKPLKGVHSSRVYAENLDLLKV